MLHEQIRINKRKTFFLMLLFSILAVITGGAIGYLTNGNIVVGLIIATIILSIYLPVTYMSANKQVSMLSGSREVSREEYPQLYNVVTELIIPARIPMPKICVIDDPVPNAFASGTKPDNATLSFTTGLLETLNREELAGVVAHEIAHVKNYDVRLMTVTIAMVSVVVLLSDIGTRLMIFGGGNKSRDNNNNSNPIILIASIVIIIIAPLLAQLTRLAVSRNREYLADASAVELTRNPVGLIRALEKISSDTRDVQRANDATAGMYIVTPFGSRKGAVSNMLSTHPPIEERIEAIKKL